MRLNLRDDRAFKFRDAGFVSPIECPLLYTLRFHEAGLRQDFEMFADGWLADAEFLGDQYAADAIGNEVAIDLRAEIPLGLPQPFQY